MLKLNILNNEINLPNDLNEISLDKGMNINYIWSNQEHNNDTKIEVLNILKPLDIWNDVLDESLDSIISNLYILNIESENNLQVFNSFRFNKKVFGIHKFNKLTVKEYMDIEFYMNYGDGALDNLDKLSSIIYRPIKRINNNLKNILINKVVKLIYRGVQPLIFKDYDIEEYNNHLENSEVMRSKFNYGMGLYALLKYTKFREQLISEFKPLFNKEEQDEYDPFKEEQDKYDREYSKDNNKSSFEENWGFYHIFVSLVPELSERDLWMKKDIKEFMKFLTYTSIKIINENNKTNNNGNN